MSETLPAVAELVRDTFPELDRRAFAVTESDVITKANLPTLPLALIGPLRQTFQHTGNVVNVQEEFVIEFWLKPNRIPRTLENGQNGETPFWSYYDYNGFRDRLLSRLIAWRTPQNGRLVFLAMEIDATEFAVTISFRFRADYRWCAIEIVDEDDGQPVKINFGICQPIPQDCGEIYCEEKESPCP